MVVVKVTKGSWSPCGKIEFGLAKASFAPLTYKRTLGGQQNGVEEEEDELVHAHQVPLEVGDEVYVVEVFRPRIRHNSTTSEDQNWYRGYVVSTSFNPRILSRTDTTPQDAALPQEPQVSFGVFPASHVHIREQLKENDGRIAEIANQTEKATERDSKRPRSRGPSKTASNGRMEPLHEEEEEEEDDGEGEGGGDGAIQTNAQKIKINIVPYGSPSKSSNRASIGSITSLNQHSKLSTSSLKPPSTEIVETRPTPPLPNLQCGDETSHGAREPLIDEIACALREWASLLNSHLSHRDYSRFSSIKRRFDTLHSGRRRLISRKLDAGEEGELKKELVECLARGNVEQGLEIIVRHPSIGTLIDADLESMAEQSSWSSIVRLYATQVSLAYGMPSPPLNRPRIASEPTSTHLPSPFSPSTPSSSSTNRFHQVFVDFRGLAATTLASTGESIELYFSLFNQSDSRYITEDFCLVLDHNGVPVRPEALSRMSTLFRDLSQHDVQDQLYLVCRIVKNGTFTRTSSAQTPPTTHRSTFMASSPGPRSESASIPDNSSAISLNGGNEVERIGNHSQEMLTTDLTGRLSCRRPFGCAVLEISQFNRKQGDAVVQQRMPIFTPSNEASFSTLHEDIIASRTREFEKDHRLDHLIIGVRILQGEDSELAQTLSNVTLTNRLGFPDVVFPDVRRNEIFIKLWSGEFSSFNVAGSGGGGATSTTRSLASLTASANANAKSVEISVELRHRDGRPFEGVLSRGSGEPNISRFTSTVFRAKNNPTWGELVKVEIPLETPEDCHLYFSFRNRSIGPSSASASTSTSHPFAFAYFPLFAHRDKAQLDGSHNLVLYRWDRSVSVPSFYLRGASTREADRPLPNLPPAVTHTLVPLQDTFTIRSFLVSTYHTQNETLIKLLRWKTDLLQDHDLAQETLSKLAFCSEVEICKFLPDIFDALFGLLSSDTNLNELVFQSIVAILGFVSDRRFTNFEPVLKLYISDHFTESNAGSYLLQSLERLLRRPGDIETAPLLRSSIKVWKWLFKFVVRSHELQQEGGGGGDSASSFEDEILSILASLKSLMRTTTPSSIIGTQTLAVQHFSSILPSLATFFKPEELTEEVISFVDSIGNAKGKMVIWRLLLLNQLVSSPPLTSDTSRSLLVPNLVRWIKPSLGKFEEHVLCKPNDPQTTRDNARVSWIEGIRLSVGVAASLLDRLQEALIDPTVKTSRTLLAQEHDNLEYLLGLLPRLFESYRELQNVANLDSVERQRSRASVPSLNPVVFPSSYPLSLLSYSPAFARSQAEDTTVADSVETWPTLQAGVGEIGAVFVALVELSPRKIFVNWLESMMEIEGTDTFARQLGQMFRVAQSIVEEEAFPSEWLNMTSLAHRATMKVVDIIADILEQDFLPRQSSSYSFNTALWRDYFSLLFKLLATPHLLIEDFSPQKRRAVWRLTGDIRAEGSKVLTRLWSAIASPQERRPLRYGGYQVHFIPTFLDDVLTLCMSRHDELRKTAVEILYSMILGEYHLNSPPQFAVIEKEVIDRFDRLFGVDAKGDELSRSGFVDQLRQLFESSEMEDDLRKQVDNFLDSINSFLDLLLDVRSLPEGEEYQEDRIISTLKLMSFIREIGRSEIYIRYVNRLVTYHIALGNETEAGLTLKLHADLHEWDLSKSVEAVPDLDLPRQTEFARKETLYMRILDHLGRGKAWESAIALSKELQHEYEANAFNYSRLAELLNLQSDLYTGIAGSTRQFGKYFRVAFYGQWPSSVAGKQFVYRGQPLESVGEFIDRMLNKHSNAQFLNDNSIPSDEIRYGEIRYLQITAIVPELDRASPVFANLNIPQYVKSYYQENEINTFSFTSPLTNNSSSKDPASLWTEKTVLICEESFPTILRRSEIVEIRLIEISPVENAFQDVEAKKSELVDLEQRYTALSENESDPRSIDSNTLSMALNDLVDPPADRGVPHYRQIFLDPAFVSTLPNWQTPIIRQLETAIDEFVVTLARCLKLHASICPREIQPFHETLERFFERSFSEELSRLPSSTWTPATFHDFAPSPTENSLDFPRESMQSPVANGLMLSSSTRDSFADRPRLGSISGASLNGTSEGVVGGGGGVRRASSVSVLSHQQQQPPQRSPSPTKSLLSSTSMVVTGSGKENGSLRASTNTNGSSSMGDEDRSVTPNGTGGGGGKRSSIFSNFGKKKGLGKRKGSVNTLAEE
ncbi:guanine nucleotide exchange factor DCK1 [Sporobolomyces salmoneus]|uniref:guanine nucleotide exchange factor DCK1 n=1 Tax=Sporobolomyces salmoneus TaxID=183962 RepID=UPI003181273E